MRVLVFALALLPSAALAQGAFTVEWEEWTGSNLYITFGNTHDNPVFTNVGGVLYIDHICDNEGCTPYDGPVEVDDEPVYISEIGDRLEVYFGGGDDELEDSDLNADTYSFDFLADFGTSSGAGLELAMGIDGMAGETQSFYFQDSEGGSLDCVNVSMCYGLGSPGKDIFLASNVTNSSSTFQMIANTVMDDDVLYDASATGTTYYYLYGSGKYNIDEVTGGSNTVYNLMANSGTGGAWTVVERGGTDEFDHNGVSWGVSGTTITGGVVSGTFTGYGNIESIHSPEPSTVLMLVVGAFPGFYLLRRP